MHGGSALLPCVRRPDPRPLALAPNTNAYIGKHVYAWTKTCMVVLHVYRLGITSDLIHAGIRAELQRSARAVIMVICDRQVAVSLPGSTVLVKDTTLAVSVETARRESRASGRVMRGGAAA